MRAVFADTFYFLALLNPRDTAHAAAVTASQTPVGRIVTTHWVLTEVADALATTRLRSPFFTLLTGLETDPDTLLVPAAPALFQKGVDLYQRRPDKMWSLTACVSFVVMEELSITEALTGDHHFQQAGFIPLLRDP